MVWTHIQHQTEPGPGVLSKWNKWNFPLIVHSFASHSPTPLHPNPNPQSGWSFAHGCHSEGRQSTLCHFSPMVMRIMEVVSWGASHCLHYQYFPVHTIRISLWSTMPCLSSYNPECINITWSARCLWLFPHWTGHKTPIYLLTLLTE